MFYEIQKPPRKMTEKDCKFTRNSEEIVIWPGKKLILQFITGAPAARKILFFSFFFYTLFWKYGQN